MRRLIESTLVTLGGEIASPHVWGPQYLNDEFRDYADKLLIAADALLLGRFSYEGFSKAYPAMDRAAPGVSVEFSDRMNSIPKYVVSNTLQETVWNATLIKGDVANRVAEPKQQPGQDILKYGTGPLDRTLIELDSLTSFISGSSPSPSGVACGSSKTSTSLPTSSKSIRRPSAPASSCLPTSLSCGAGRRSC